MLTARLVARGYTDASDNNQAVYRWHSILRVTANGGVVTLCGRRFAVNGVTLREEPVSCLRCLTAGLPVFVQELPVDHVVTR